MRWWPLTREQARERARSEIGRHGRVKGGERVTPR